ncbi:hypothetical protein [Candidatus Finniella inopinata]|uniref:Uncharacterized protein n=1 Tax=Candidatus Finniella inopinata TaxID=1696036 RepID=A0A4V2DZX5_9PROT|nr:hypothetical protein [Candidatus Finniella inopinata]RZI46577.1 hypothetical protein EQU50_03040 [Candidatus Finniella inopinata]
MKNIATNFLLALLLLSSNTSLVQASAAADGDSIIVRAKTLRNQSSSQALDLLLEAVPSQDPQIRTMINEWGSEVYNAAMNGTGEFDKETGDVYLKRHANMIQNGYAQSCLNTIALRSSRRYTDATGRQYLEDRFTNHNDADAGGRLNTAAAEGLRGFTESAGLQYLEQQVKRYMEPEALAKLTGEAYDKQLTINALAQNAIDQFIELMYKPTLPKYEINAAVTWSVDYPPSIVVEVHRSMQPDPNYYPEKTIFQAYAPTLFEKTQEQYQAKLVKDLEPELKNTTEWWKNAKKNGTW